MPHVHHLPMITHAVVIPLTYAPPLARTLKEKNMPLHPRIIIRHLQRCFLVFLVTDCSLPVCGIWHVIVLNFNKKLVIGWPIHTYLRYTQDNRLVSLGCRERKKKGVRVTPTSVMKLLFTKECISCCKCTITIIFQNCRERYISLRGCHLSPHIQDIPSLAERNDKPYHSACCMLLSQLVV